MERDTLTYTGYVVVRGGESVASGGALAGTWRTPNNVTRKVSRPGVGSAIQVRSRSARRAVSSRPAKKSRPDAEEALQGTATKRDVYSLES